MMDLGLSGTGRLGLSGTADSDYREPNPLATFWNHSPNPAPSNYANLKEYFVFLLTGFRTVDNSRHVGSAEDETSPRLLRYTALAYADTPGGCQRPRSLDVLPVGQGA